MQLLLRKRTQVHDLREEKKDTIFGAELVCSGVGKGCWRTDWGCCQLLSSCTVDSDGVEEVKSVLGRKENFCENHIGSCKIPAIGSCLCAIGLFSIKNDTWTDRTSSLTIRNVPYSQLNLLDEFWRDFAFSLIL